MVFEFSKLKAKNKENKSKPNFKNQAQTFCWILILNEYA